MADEYAGFGAETAYNGFGADPYLGFQPEPDRGILGSIMHEIGLDVLGTGRVVAATGGELVSLLGMAAPITYDDLSTRDVRGAMMMAALGVGGIAAAPVRGALGIASTAAGRAGATALTEAVSGAAFGLIAPLEDDQTRLGSVASNAAFGGALGAGASMVKSAAKAVLGARIAAIRAAGARTKMLEAMQHGESELLARELAGVQLRNADSGEIIGIQRQPDGTVLSTIHKPGVATVTSEASDFGASVADAMRRGFMTDLGAYDPKRMLAGMEGRIDQRTLDMIANSQGNITEALGLAQLSKYKAIKEYAAMNEQARRELTPLVGEVLAPSNWLGEPVLSSATREQLERELGVRGLQAAKMSDVDLLREGARKGLVEVDNFVEGGNIDDFTFELFANGQLPADAAADIIVNRRRDAVFTSVLLPNRIAKFFPEVAPVVAEADARLAGLDANMRVVGQWLFDLRDKVSPASANAAVDIIEASVVEGDLVASRALAQQAAAATGNAEVVYFVDTVVPKLEEYLGRAQQAGMIEEGLSGYFPIVNANKWRLDVQDFGGNEVAFKGFHNTKADALAEVARLRAINPAVRGTISPRSFSFDKSELMAVNGAQYGRMRKALIEAYTEAFSEVAEEGDDIAAMAREATEGALDERFVVRQNDYNRRSTGFARQRKLGVRDFSEDPMDALTIYMSNMERTLALRDFERIAAPIIDALPDSQTRLKAWGEQFIADILGRPRPVEEAFDALMTTIGADVQPRALRRYSTAIRKWESVSRLGGFFSGIVNLSQIAINTYPVLGARDTARGFAGLANASVAARELADHGLDLGLHIPFTEAGEASRMFFGGPTAAFKEKRYFEAASRIALSIFNGAEAMNRFVTAWGTYQREIGKIAGRAATREEKVAAANIARDVMERTQFNYRMSNMPEVLRGPVGGLLLQFKSFIINEIDFIASMSPKEAARFGQAVISMGGLGVVLNTAGPDLVNLSSLAWSHEKLDEKLMGKALEADSAGEDAKAAAWRTVLYGLPSLVNINLSDHVGIGTTADITGGILGPFGKDMMAIGTFIKDAALDHGATGQVSETTKKAFVTAALPSAMRRLKRGVDIMQTGEVRSAYSGKLLYQPEKRMREAYYTAIGFPSVQYTEELAAGEVIERARTGYIRARQSFGRQIAMAVIEGDNAAYQQHLADASAAGHVFNGRDVSRWVAEMRKPAASRRERRTPRALRDEMAAFYDLTGSLEPR